MLLAVPPVIQSISPSRTVPEYSPDIAINCEVSGHPVPDPTITWTLNGKSLQAGHGVTIKDKKDKDITTWRLKISQLLRNYSGIYTCRASNAGGSSHLSTLVTVICKLRYSVCHFNTMSIPFLSYDSCLVFCVQYLIPGF